MNINFIIMFNNEESKKYLYLQTPDKYSSPSLINSERKRLGMKGDQRLKEYYDSFESILWQLKRAREVTESAHFN